LQRLGHRVVEAEDGETALSYFEDSQAFAPDLVFTDMVMPRMGGLQLARKIEKKMAGDNFSPDLGLPGSTGNRQGTRNGLRLPQKAVFRG
jgi:CheY-like chemotaxis protein